MADLKLLDWPQMSEKSNLSWSTLRIMKNLKIIALMRDLRCCLKISAQNKDFLSINLSYSGNKNRRLQTKKNKRTTFVFNIQNRIIYLFSLHDKSLNFLFIVGF